MEESCDNDNHISISDIFLNYDKVSKDFWCPKCSFSCLSRQVYDNHPCDERLEYMTNCTVKVKKFDHSEALNENEGVRQNKSCSEPIKSIQDKIKEVIPVVENCESKEDVMKLVVQPILEEMKRVDHESSSSNSSGEILLRYAKEKLLDKTDKKFCSDDVREIYQSLFGNICQSTDLILQTLILKKS